MFLTSFFFLYGWEKALQPLENINYWHIWQHTMSADHAGNTQLYNSNIASCCDPSTLQPKAIPLLLFTLYKFTPLFPTPDLPQPMLPTANTLNKHSRNRYCSRAKLSPNKAWSNTLTCANHFLNTAKSKNLPKAKHPKAFPFLRLTHWTNKAQS